MPILNTKCLWPLLASPCDFLLKFRSSLSVTTIPFLPSLPATISSSFTTTLVPEDPVFQMDSSAAILIIREDCNTGSKLTGSNIMATFLFTFNLRFKRKAYSYNLRNRSMAKVAKEVKPNAESLRRLEIISR